ncbi:MAG: hypothetical protein HQK91_03970 [Nitrospirae bacterium]|nr:hypothetical protein [Nitrospirota bacterium]MBF0540594.1 hypothetical protein [Nitrospirota bacterium]
MLLPIKILIKKINSSFFNPFIEDFYWENQDLIRHVIKKDFKYNFPRKVVPSIDIETNNTSKIFLIKQSFKKYKLKYKKPNFAENFFSQFDYIHSSNNAIKRILKFIDNNMTTTPIIPCQTKQP